MTRLIGPIAEPTKNGRQGHGLFLQDDLLPTLVERRALSHPSDICMVSSAGSFDFRTLWDIVLANAEQFSSIGINQTSRIAIVSNSSPLAVVALLATMKVGAMAVPISSPVPAERYLSIAHTSGITHVLDLGVTEETVLSNGQLQKLHPKPAMHSASSTHEQTILPIGPSTPAIAVFTSGSSGVAKGVVHSHASLSTMAIAIGEAVDMHPGERNLLFASFGWGLNIVETAVTFAAGACLCIPNNVEKSQALEQFISDMRVTRTSLPGSMLANLDPRLVPSLKTIVIAGESARRDVIARWAPYARLHWNFGSSETWMTLLGDASDCRNCGYALPSCLGSVTSADGTEVGEGGVGELIVEAHTAFMGYLDAGAIVAVPRRGPHGGGLVHTGDLFERSKDSPGLLIYRGRNDSQLKLNGQRLAPEEVESQLWVALKHVRQLAITMVKLQGSHRSAGLVAVMIPHRREWTCHFEHLSRALPAYMIPIGALVVDLPTLPRLSNGKLDRNGVRKLAEQHHLEQLVDLRRRSVASAGESLSEASTTWTQIVREIWSATLDLPQHVIASSSSFFLLGGNSLDAMRACKAFGKQNIRITLAAFFTHPTFEDMVRLLSTQTLPTTIAVEGDGTLDAEPRLVLNGEVPATEAALAAAREHGIEPQRIEHAYPCAALQAGMMSTSALQQGTYTATRTFHLPQSWTRPRVDRAWQAVVRAAPILRTRIVQLEGGEMWNIQLSSLDPAALLPVRDPSTDAHFGTLGNPLFLDSLDEDPVTRELVWTWHIHHAILDRWSTALLLHMVEQEYATPDVVHSFSFSDVAAAIARQQHSSAAKSFWEHKLDSFVGTPYPTLPRSHERSWSSRRASFEVAVERGRSPTTQATSIQVALALLIARMSGETDVFFGMTVHGRDLPDCPNADLVVGPAIATIPVRIELDLSLQTSELLQQIQTETAQMLEYQHLGLQNIASIAPHLDFASKFQTLLVVQQDYDFESRDHHEKIREEYAEPNDFDLNYALVLECFPHQTGVKVDISYDSSVLSAWQVQTLGRHFGQLLTALESPAASTTRVRDLNLLDSQSLSRILEISRGHVYELRQCLHDRIFDRAQEWPAEAALDGWDTQCTYGELAERVQTLTARLRRILSEVPGRIVPICWPKSAGCVIVALSVLSAGHGFLLLDPSLPKQRLQYMVDAVAADCILCTTQTASITDQMSVPSFNLDLEVINESESAPHGPIAAASPDSPAYCMFTSGSTGNPKGVLLLHKQVTSGLQAQCDFGLFTRKTRVFQFSSYSFDTCIADIFATLLVGGCVCIPRDEDKLTRIAESINNFKANLVDLTPSVSELLKPGDVTTLTTFRFGGEPVQQYHVDPWMGKCIVQNGYGPAECCVQCTFVEYVAGMSPLVIGHGINCNTWVVDPHSHSFLMPEGAIGELAVQGPSVAIGYINNLEATTKSFVARAPFLNTYNIPCEYPTYFTGDMVKYDEQGRLIFLGRRDNQIKVRGQRVQLEEVEHVLQKTDAACHAIVCYPSTGRLASELVAVMGDRASEPLSNSTSKTAPHDEADELHPSSANRTRLCVEKAKEMLPSHMVPTVYLSTDKALLQTSGKLDRRSIARWVEQVTERELVASTVYRLGEESITKGDSPQVSEAQVAPILERIALLTRRTPGKLKQHSSADTQSFSSIGLDSIALVAFLRWINKSYGSCIDMQTLLRLGTVRTLVSHLYRTGEASDAVTQTLDTRDMLAKVVESGVKRLCGERQSGELRNVVLTGATSLVGTSLILELLKRMPDVIVTAIVRCTDADSGKDRLLGNLRLLRRWSAEFTSRISVWPGDLSRPRLGLSASHWSYLSQQECGPLAIIHAGAAVDWYGDLEGLKRVNVDATLDLVEHATYSDGVERLIYLSGGLQWDPNEHPNEILKGDGLGNFFEDTNAYGQTKSVASAIIQRSAACSSHLAAKNVVIRPAIIIGSCCDGVPNTDDLIWRVVRACYNMGAYPGESECNWLYLAGADFLAETIVTKISAPPQIFETRIEEGLPVETFWAVVNEELGGLLQRVDHCTWLERLQSDVAVQEGDDDETSSHPCLPIIHILAASSSVLGAEPPSFVSQESKQLTVDHCVEAVRSNMRYLVDIGCFTCPASTWSARVFGRRKQA